MLSTFPESAFADHFTHFEPGWGTIEPAQLSPEPVSSNTGSDNSNPNPVTPSSVLEAPILDSTDIIPKKHDPGSVEPDRVNPKRALNPNLIDERKRRRMISNRDSARRSRMRKQRHLENMRNLLNNLKVSNRELTDRVRVAMHQNHVVRSENEFLRSEAAVLRQRLWGIRQVLVVRELQQHINNDAYAWPCNSNNVDNNNYYNNYNAMNNVLSSTNISYDGQLKHHSLTA